MTFCHIIFGCNKCCVCHTWLFISIVSNYKIMNLKLGNSACQELLCAICKKFLIYFPIRVCADGRIICGKCQPEGDNVFPLIKVPLLDTILRMATLSCKFKINGCDTEATSEFLEEHEKKCLYLSATHHCSICMCRVALVDTYKHYDQAHIVSDVLALSINLEKNIAVHVKMAIIEGTPFAFRYQYDAFEKQLNFKITYMSADINKAAYEITSEKKKLMKGECIPDLNYTVMSNLLSLGHSRNASNGIVVNSNTVKLAIHITYTKYEWTAVNYSNLKALLCYKCGGYLIPFAYDYKPSQFLCGLCAEKNNINVISKQPISEIIKNTNFPCKWKYCLFVSGAIKMYNHQKTCRFQIYTCAWETCVARGDLDLMKTHLEISHQCQYFQEQHRAKFDGQKCFTVKHGTIIIVVFGSSNVTFKVTLKISGSRNEVATYLQLEHDHCVIKSKWIPVVNEYVLKIEDVPPCFLDEDGLTATVKIS